MLCYICDTGQSWLCLAYCSHLLPAPWAGPDSPSATPWKEEAPLSSWESTGMSDMAVDQTSAVLAGDFKNSYFTSFIFHSWRGESFGERSAHWSRTAQMSCTGPFTRRQGHGISILLLCHLLSLCWAYSYSVMALFSPSPRLNELFSPVANTRRGWSVHVA